MLKKTLISIIAITAITLSVFIITPKNENRVEKYVISDNIITNNEQGYSYSIPEGFVLNEEFYPNNIRLENSDIVIEIYQEDITGDDQISYITYTNKAIIENNINYSDISTFTEDNKTILTWNRKKLSRIENDKNYYLKIDFSSQETVHTILVKSANKIDNYHEYADRFSLAPKSELIESEPIKKHASKRKFNEETQKFYDKVFSDSSKLSWGIFHPEYMSNDSLAQFENEIKHKFDYALWYAGFEKEYNKEMIGDFLTKTYADGKIAEMTLQPLLEHKEGNDLFRLLDGEYDKFLDDCAKDISDFDHPVIFRLANEMNGDWCEYSAYRMSLDTELYREMYRYVYSFFEKHNADNVIWVWNPNGKSFPNYKWNSEDMYYPGNEYVDILGLTLYNTGNFYEGEEWIEFSDLYTPLYEKSVAKYDMPFMITEFSCARAGGNKEEWTKKMLSEIEKFDKIKVAVWWNSADFSETGDIARAYYINDSNEMVEIFKNYFSKKN